MTIGHISVLPSLFDAVTIPRSVEAELLRLEAPDAVRAIINAPPAWLRIDRTSAAAEGFAASLDDGERNAIALAITLRAGMVLMDDRAGVKIARSMGLTVTGTLGVLVLGARRGLLNLGDAFNRLRDTNFRYRADLLDELLAAHKARARS